MSRDATERQRAFTGLLAQPVLDRRRDPELFALVRNPRHRRVLIEWFATRLGYRLVVTESAVRLFRLPLGSATGSVTGTAFGDPLGTAVIAPRRHAAPSRRVLVLAVLAAAAAEDAEDVTTTQDLSDRVRVLTRHEDVEVAPYEPDRFAERQSFVKAVDLLVTAGALRPVGRDSEDRRDGWTHRQDAVGAAYEVERELLLRMVDPAALAAALGERADHEPGVAVESTARFGVMRRLIELPVCLIDDLTEAERAYLASQRHRIVAWCTEMTGWVVEQRAEGLALIAAEERDTDLPFPRMRATDFATLMMIEELLDRSDGRGLLDDAQLNRAAAEVRARHPKAMTKELGTDAAVRERVVELLQALDLLRPSAGGAGKDSTAGGTGWWLSPAAARFRNPRVVAVTSRLDEEGDG